MRVSVVMASYNGARHIAQQLESFALQTRRPDEIVVSDDGSTDDTCAIVADCARRWDLDIRLVRHARPTPAPDGAYLAVARNFANGVAHATGDVVFFSDQDDYALPGKIEAVLAAFEAWPDAAVVIHDIEICDGDLNLVGQTGMQRADAIGGAMKYYCAGMSVGVRRSFLNVCLPFPENALHDYWIDLCARLLRKKRLLRQPLGLYRLHGGNVSGAEMLNFAGRRSRFAILAAKVRRTLTAGEARRLLTDYDARLRQMIAWLDAVRERGVATGAFTNEEHTRAARDARAELALVERRLAILRKPKLLRVWLVARLYAEGGYRPFQGGMAAVKDLLA